MLRIFVIAVAAILMCVGVGLIACGVHVPGWQVLIIGTLILIGTLLERWRYSHIEPPSNGQWQRTDERFLDPSTGDPVEVLFDPRSGERRYVPGSSTAAQGSVRLGLVSELASRRHLRA
jgi:hypothetical protein